MGSRNRPGYTLSLIEPFGSHTNNRDLAHLLSSSYYGYEGVSQRLSYRWLYTITRNAVAYNGTVPEKLDVVKRSHDVFAEYGNVGTEFEYIPMEGFG